VVTGTRLVYQYPLIAVDTTGRSRHRGVELHTAAAPVYFDANVRWAGTFSPGCEQVCG
jgi:hypothetical protein